MMLDCMSLWVCPVLRLSQESGIGCLCYTFLYPFFGCTSPLFPSSDSTDAILLGRYVWFSLALHLVLVLTDRRLTAGVPCQTCDKCSLWHSPDDKVAVTRAANQGEFPLDTSNRSRVLTSVSIARKLWFIDHPTASSDRMIQRIGPSGDQCDSSIVLRPLPHADGG